MTKCFAVKITDVSVNDISTLTKTTDEIMELSLEEPFRLIYGFDDFDIFCVLQ